MCCKGFLKKSIPTALALMISFFAINVFGQKHQIKPCDLSGLGSGFSGDNAYSSDDVIENKPKLYPKGTRPLQITSKPTAKYTDQARKNCIEGVVRLKITFFSSGKVGNFKVINGLANGLSAQAIEAVKLIKFQPAMKRGKAVVVRKTVSYNFTIY